MKPDFVFFGESIRQEVKDRRYVTRQEVFFFSSMKKTILPPKLTTRGSYSIVEGADRLFVIGTTLATYSAFRCVSLHRDLLGLFSS